MPHHEQDEGPIFVEDVSMLAYPPRFLSPLRRKYQGCITGAFACAWNLEDFRTIEELIQQA
jgi:hypothetical protein